MGDWQATGAALARRPPTGPPRRPDPQGPRDGTRFSCELMTATAAPDQSSGSPDPPGRRHLFPSENTMGLAQRLGAMRRSSGRSACAAPWVQVPEAAPALGSAWGAAPGHCGSRVEHRFTPSWASDTMSRRDLRQLRVTRHRLEPAGGGGPRCSWTAGERPLRLALLLTATRPPRDRRRARPGNQRSASATSPRSPTGRRWSARRLVTPTGLPDRRDPGGKRVGRSRRRDAPGPPARPPATSIPDLLDALGSFGRGSPAEGRHRGAEAAVLLRPWTGRPRQEHRHRAARRACCGRFLGARPYRYDLRRRARYGFLLDIRPAR